MDWALISAPRFEHYDAKLTVSLNYALLNVATDAFRYHLIYCSLNAFPVFGMHTSEVISNLRNSICRIEPKNFT